jgi:hypothetical protein
MELSLLRKKIVEKEETTRIRLVKMRSLNIVLKVRKMKKHLMVKKLMAKKLMDQLKVKVTKQRIRKKRRKNQMLLKISYIRTLWTTKKKENSSLSGKNIDMVTGEKDQAKHSLLLRLKFLVSQKNFFNHLRKNLSMQNKEKLRTKSRRLQVSLRKKRPVSKIFYFKRMLK